MRFRAERSSNKIQRRGVKMATREQDIVAVIKEQIERFGAAVTVTNVGTVIEVGDGIARIHGLGQVAYNELIQFPHDITGLALNLEEDNVGAVILGDVGKTKGEVGGKRQGG